MSATEHLAEYLKVFQRDPEAAMRSFEEMKRQVAAQEGGEKTSTPTSALGDIASWRQQLLVSNFSNTLSLPNAIVTGSATETIQSGGGEDIVEATDIPVSIPTGNSERLEAIYTKVKETNTDTAFEKEMGSRLNQVRELERSVHDNLVEMNTRPMLKPIQQIGAQYGGALPNDAIETYVKESNKLNNYLDETLDFMFKHTSM
tara:strand:- start:666 stop:1271 length:606 start_codon:yes stop_codon:yes gene_type:complete